MKTKKFNLKSAKSGARIVTKDGLPVRYLCELKDINKQYVFAAAIDFGDREEVYSFQKNGQIAAEPHQNDLLLVDE